MVVYVPLCAGGILEESVRDPLEQEGVAWSILLQSQIALKRRRKTRLKKHRHN